jgi:hypothetical protein
MSALYWPKDKQMEKLAAFFPSVARQTMGRWRKGADRRYIKQSQGFTVERC